MSDLPSKWVDVELREVISSVKGKKPKVLSEMQYKGMIPYIDIRAFEHSDIRQFADTETSNTCAKEDILVVWDGARCGLVGIGQEGAIASTIASLKPYLLESQYIYRFLQTQYEIINTQNKGTGIPHVDPEIFWNIMLPLPPLSEQRRIVAKLEKLLFRVNACKERLERIPSILKRFRQSVLAAACSGKLTEDWREKNHERKKNIETRNIKSLPYSLDLDIYELDNENSFSEDHFRELPILPPGWNYLKIDSLKSSKPRSIQSGPFGSNLLHSEFTNQGILAIGIDNVGNGIFTMGKQHRISYEKYLTLKHYSARPHDVLITVMGTVGRCCVIPEDMETAIITKHVYRITVDVNKINPFFIMYCLLGDPFIVKQINDKIRGATRPGINGSIIKNILVSVPPIDEQDVIVKRIKRTLEFEDIVECRYKKAKNYVEKLTQSILAKAFRGELVPQDPNDEPASVLLERIKREKESQETLDKSIKSKRIKHAKVTMTDMEEKVMASLYNILKSFGKPMKPEELLEKSGIENIDEFYSELKNEWKKGRIIENRPDDATVTLETNV